MLAVTFDSVGSSDISPVHPETCLTAVSGTVDELRILLNDEPLVELRLDKLGLETPEIRALVAQAKGQVIATCKSAEHLETEDRTRLLQAAVEAGATYVDCDGADTIDGAALIRGSNSKLIISWHFEASTPSREDLLAAISMSRRNGAHLVKIGAFIRNKSDSARMLGLLGELSNLILVGLGPKGFIVRAMAPILGAPFTYAAIDDQRRAVPFQPTRAELANWYEQHFRQVPG